TFDAPDRESCTVRRSRTNTPLQALVLMNDPTYVEASRKLAERLMKEANTTDERIVLAFRLTTARNPKAEELAVLRRVYEQQVAVYRKDRQAALKLLGVGESKRDEKLDVGELASWAVIASVVLNLDETVTRGEHPVRRRTRMPRKILSAESTLLLPDLLWAELGVFYRWYGYLRRPSRLLFPRCFENRHLWEVRFVLDTAAQLRRLQWLLKQAGLKLEPSFRKYGRHQQGLYGPEVVDQFKALGE